MADDKTQAELKAAKEKAIAYFLAEDEGTYVGDAIDEIRQAETINDLRERVEMCQGAMGLEPDTDVVFKAEATPDTTETDEGEPSDRKSNPDDPHDWDEDDFGDGQLGPEGTRAYAKRPTTTSPR